MPGLIVSSVMIFALVSTGKTVERYDPERDCWENTPSMGRIKEKYYQDNSFSEYNDGIKIVCALPVPASFPTPLPHYQVFMTIFCDRISPWKG